MTCCFTFGAKRHRPSALLQLANLLRQGGALVQQRQKVAVEPVDLLAQDADFLLAAGRGR